MHTSEPPNEHAMSEVNDSLSAERVPSVAAAVSSADEWSRPDAAEADAEADLDLGDCERPVILTRSAGNSGLLVEQAERISSASVASSASVLALAGSLLGDAEREAQLDVSLEPAFFDASAEEPESAFSTSTVSATASRDKFPGGWNMRIT